MTRILSGVQVTGNLHLGNYLGSIKNWVELQEKYESFLFLADLHSITLPQDPKELKKSIYYIAATYIACGIDPKKAVIFAQSSVAAHTELAWIFSCITPIGWLNRMTQFKDKAGKDKETASLGLYAYPVLMAADILLYAADIVPVGEDQKQHLELTRDIAAAFNRFVGQEFFNLPNPLISGVATRVMSLKDGSKKMSKSDSSDAARINLIDNADTIRKKLSKAKTDSIESISYDKTNRPEITNLLNIYMSITGKNLEQTIDQFNGKGFAYLKSNLADILIEKIGPITSKINQLTQNLDYLDEILKDGAERANMVAQSNLNKIKQLFGFPIL